MSRKDHARPLFTGAVIFMAALSLAACGSSSKPGKTTGQTTTSATKGDSSASPSHEESERANRRAIITLSSCLRQHGIHVPPQDLSAASPTFNSKGVNTSGAAFKGCTPRAIEAYETVLKSAVH